MKEQKIIRAFKFNTNYLTKSKANNILKLHKAYQDMACKITNVEWKYFYQGKFTKFSNQITEINRIINVIPSIVSNTYKQNITALVCGQLNSFIENRKNDFKKIIYKSNFSEEIKKQLYYINKFALFYAKENILIKYNKVNINNEVLKLARQIFNHLCKQNKLQWGFNDNFIKHSKFANTLKHNKPNLKHCNMVLDVRLADLQLAKQNKLFKYYVNLTSLIKGKKILIPLKSNNYFENKNGNILNGIQLNVNDKNEINIYLLKEIVNDVYIPKTKQVAFDMGLKNLFTFTDGNVYGNNLLTRLNKYNTKDKAIKEMQKNRANDINKKLLIVKDKEQQNKLNNLLKLNYKKSKGFQLLTLKYKEFLKNFINYSMNKFLNYYKPAEIILEDLNFQKCNLFKAMNRKLSNFGKGIITKKLEQWKKELGIELTYINPAYTSQQCSKCGFVNEFNRKTQADFKCLNCGLEINADVNGARNIIKRKDNNEITLYTKYTKVKEILMRNITVNINKKRNYLLDFYI